MCACTEPVRTGIGAVCVEYGRPKWPITMLNHTQSHTCIQKIFCFFLFLAPYARTTRYEEPFFSLENQGKKRLASLARLIVTARSCLWHQCISGLIRQGPSPHILAITCGVILGNVILRSCNETVR